jgi:hypothetical protein
MKVLKIIFSILFSILFAFFVIMTAFFGIANKTISQDYIMSKLDESDIYAEIQNRVQDMADEYIESNPENEEVLSEFITEENVENVVNELSDSIYKNEGFDFSSEGLKELLNDNIDSIILEKNIELTDEQKQDIDNFIQEISDEYESSFSSADTDLENTTEDLEENNISEESSLKKNIEFVNIIPQMLKALKQAYVFCFTVTLILAVIVILINLKNLTSGVDFIASGLLISGILLFGFKKILSIASTKDFWLKQSQGATDGMINVFVSICKDLAKAFENWGKAFILLAFVAVIISVIIYSVKKTNKKEKVVQVTNAGDIKNNNGPVKTNKE